MPHEQIAHLAGLSENTIRDYFLLYQAGGLDKLKEVNLYRLAAFLGYLWSLERIFKALFIRTTSVRSHVTKILTKLNVANRTQAALVAQQMQLA